MGGDAQYDDSYLARDRDSFTAPLDAAIAGCTRALADAGKKIKGAEARARAALEDLESLEQFIREVERRLREQSFHDLPGLRLDEPRFRSLAIGPWRGVFLVAADEPLVIGLVFSRYPHALERRLGELAARYDEREPHP